MTTPTSEPTRYDTDSDAYYELTMMCASTRKDDAYITQEWKLTFGAAQYALHDIGGEL